MKAVFMRFIKQYLLGWKFHRAVQVHYCIPFSICIADITHLNNNPSSAFICWVLLSPACFPYVLFLESCSFFFYVQVGIVHDTVNISISVKHMLSNYCCECIRVQGPRLRQSLSSILINNTYMLFLKVLCKAMIFEKCRVLFPNFIVECAWKL